ncbi:hypothetical protein SDC9_185806 [bioreactor metagenome]|uniref:Uncharacterized protein n=1 Tax=bioreactor metagenome TaxID=1076179 RepID=A0A645HIP6_9ZZZZ
MAHPAHLHQFAGLCLHAFGNIYHHNNTVHSRQCTIGILGKILVTGCIENINLIIAILKSHNGCGNRNSTLPLYLHPVGRGGFLYFIRLYGSRHVNGAAKKQ